MGGVLCDFLKMKLKIDFACQFQVWKVKMKSKNGIKRKRSGFLQPDLKYVHACVYVESIAFDQ